MFKIATFLVTASLMATTAMAQQKSVSCRVVQYNKQTKTHTVCANKVELVIGSDFRAFTDCPGFGLFSESGSVNVEFPVDTIRIQKYSTAVVDRVVPSVSPTGQAVLGFETGKPLPKEFLGWLDTSSEELSVNCDAN